MSKRAMSVEWLHDAGAWALLYENGEMIPLKFNGREGCLWPTPAAISAALRNTGYALQAAGVVVKLGEQAL